MAKTLGGSLFIRNGIEFDYCFEEAIKCLQEMCDEVAIVDAGSSDGTDQIVRQFEDKKTTVLCLPQSSWHEQHGREKLSYFSNMAHQILNTDYIFNLQGDEIVHENSYDAVRKAIELNEEGFFVSRINLWKDPFHALNVPHERKPCSTEIIRLAKRGYKSYDDAESLDVMNASVWFLKSINIFHYGFVRKKEVMKSKIIEMQENVFEMGSHDHKLDSQDVFDWSAWFSEEDLITMPKEMHPKIMQEWTKTHP